MEAKKSYDPPSISRRYISQFKDGGGEGERERETDR
jgi:hypothetical protein